ncbi:MAG: oligosaccharide flippase family protein, partial [Deltaproteobacteria bacterium]|nr:oligosaccharide flippase family protein [Deltaproteobacteria bacterium]
MESQTNKDVKKVAKGAGTAVTGRFLGRIFIFLTQVAIARLFGAEIFGLYALGMATVRFSELFSRLGLDKGGMMFVAIYRDESPSKLKGVVYSATGFSFLCGSVLGILLYLFSGLISVYIFKEPQLQETIKLFAFCVPFFSSVTVVASLLQGFYSIKYAVYSRDIIQPLVNLILIIIFYYFGFALSGAIFAFTLSNIFAFAAGIWYIHKAFGYLKIKYIKSQYEFKKLFSYSTPFLFAGLLYYLFAWIDTLMLGFLGTAKDVGIYR